MNIKIVLISSALTINYYKLKLTPIFMKLKQIPQDFIVNEIYNIDDFKDRDENRTKPYYYFKLTKTNYNQIKALEIIAKTFNTSTKLVHFAGTKDKTGVTTQLVSVYGINELNFEKNLEHLHETFEDLKLELVGKFKARINLGDNGGNSFEITVRDLEEKEIEKAIKNLKKLEEFGVLNYFDEQRFGYANNSHIVGKYVLKNEIENAVKEIMTSLPANTQSEILVEFVNFIKENWEEIKEKNIEIIDKALELCPRYLNNEKEILLHLKIHKNDYPGAFRKIHKKLRMLYINAYQSYIFNEAIKNLRDKNLIENYPELELVNKDIIQDEILKEVTDKILENDGLSLEQFTIKHMPELRIYGDKRKTRIFVRNLKISESENDELNEGKLKVLVSFDLDSGEYATNVVKQLFE